MTFGSQQADFLRDVPESPAQAVGTRLRLFSGEWFLDIEAGVPYQISALGTGKADTIEPMIRDAVLNTQGVTAITSYSAQYDPEARTYTAALAIDTIYGAATINEVL